MSRRDNPRQVEAIDGITEFTDSHNADRLVALAGDRIRYIPKWGVWLTWSGSCWERDDRSVNIAEIGKEIGRALLRQAADSGDDARTKTLIGWGRKALAAPAIRAAVELARGIDGISVDHEDLDADPYLLGVLNGAVDLRTGELAPPSPESLITMQCPVEYDPEAQASRWAQALEEWHPDSDTRAYLQRLVGEALVGSQRRHMFVLHYGSGANGKGTAMRALCAVMGPYAAVVHKSLLIASREQHETERAKLFRCRLALAAETDRRVRLAEAAVKNLTGGDRLSARRLYQDPFEFDPSHSLWLQTNHLPEITGRDPGIWRRIRVVPWLAHFGNGGDPDLDEALAAEAPGILRWAVDGARQYLELGLDEPEEVRRATVAYRSAEDVLARFAGDVGLVFAAGRAIPGTELINLAEAWSRQTGAAVVVGDLTGWLEDNGASKKRQPWPDKPNKIMVWNGVGIADSEPSGQGGQGISELFPIPPLREKVGNTPVHPVRTPVDIDEIDRETEAIAP